jgi:hypothetical protein
MLIGVMFSSFVSVVASVERMTVGGVRVMTALFMVAAVVMLGSFAVVSCRMLVMLCGLGMVRCTLMLASHGLPRRVDKGCGPPDLGQLELTAQRHDDSEVPARLCDRQHPREISQIYGVGASRVLVGGDEVHRHGVGLRRRAEPVHENV